MAGIWQVGSITATNTWDMGSEGAYTASFSISTVGTANVFADGDTAIPVTGVDLDTVTSAIIETSDSAYQVDVTASYSASDAGNAIFDHARGDTPLTSSSYQLRLALSDGVTTVYRNVTIAPASGYQVVELAGTLVLTDPESGFAPYTGPDPVVGDQYIVPLATTEGAPITANADTTLEYDYSGIDPVPATDSHDIEWWSSNGAVRVWSAGTLTVNQPLEGEITVGMLTIGRDSASIPFSYSAADADGFEYQLDGGVWTQVVSPVALSGLTAETAYTVGIRAYSGSVKSAVATVEFTTNAAVDTTPSPFSFTAQTDVARSDTVTSNAMTVQGVDAGVDVPVSITNGEYQVSTDGGSTWGGWTSSATNVRLNYQIQVRHTSSPLYATATDTALTVGGVQGTFTSTTLTDTVKPVITLTDGNIQLTVGDNWAEPGYSATDNADGDLTGSVVVTGTVNTAVADTYYLTYSVTDSAGNVGTATRTVTVVPEVVDDVAPVISLVGGNVTLQVGDTWVEPGYTATDNLDGDLTDQVTITGTVDTTQVGENELTYSVPDSDGNVGTATRIVYVEAALELDDLAPDSRTYVCKRTQRIEAAGEQFMKQPGELLDYDFDMTDWLTEQGDTLAASGHSVDVIGDGLVIEQYGQIPGTSRYKVWLGEGDHGNNYPVRLTAKTTGGRTVIFQFRVVVIRRY